MGEPSSSPALDLPIMTPPSPSRPSPTTVPDAPLPVFEEEEDSDGAAGGVLLGPAVGLELDDVGNWDDAASQAAAVPDLGDLPASDSLLEDLPDASDAAELPDQSVSDETAPSTELGGLEEIAHLAGLSTISSPSAASPADAQNEDLPSLPPSQAQGESISYTVTASIFGLTLPFGPLGSVPEEPSPELQLLAASSNISPALYQITEADAPVLIYDHEPNDFCSFIHDWRSRESLFDNAHRVGGDWSNISRWSRPANVLKEELQGDEYDIQGIDWTKLRTTREQARTARKRLYRQQHSRKGVKVSQWATEVPDSENYFRFRQMRCEHRAALPHFQLRHLLAANSRNDIYYAADQYVTRCDIDGVFPNDTTDTTPPSVDGSFASGTSITSLAASPDVLITGHFNGEYGLKDLRSTYPGIRVKGAVTRDLNAITNHIQLSPARRSGQPLATFCSNDRRLRVLDCYTNKFVRTCEYEQAVNCSANSPDGRLRMVVGDCSDTLITDADSGQAVERLRYHDDHAFACAWADDGIHAATAAQDSQIVVYDARWWRHPVTVIKTEMAFCRSLHFSPVGGGRRVLVAAEADDTVSVIDARSFDRKQVLDFYGSIAGVAFTPDGRDLIVANCDYRYGGLIHFERAGYGENFGTGRRVHWRAPTGAKKAKVLDWDDEAEYPHEWVAEPALDADPRVLRSTHQRRRRGLPLHEVVV